MGNGYRSQIRDGEVVALLEKVRRKSYGRYLLGLEMRRLRGFRDTTVRFDFPVTALVGPNGGGKTTILGAAAVAYLGIKPGTFFAKSGRYDDSMENWAIEHELIDQAIAPGKSVRRLQSFSRLKWSRHSIERSIVVFGVSRTVPASERTELRKCASNRFEVAQGNVDAIAAEVATAVHRILGKDIRQFNHLRVDVRGRISLLTGRTAGGDNYSEFHFGAGESSVIRMVMKIEQLPDHSLILIEEIENGLHPVATARMVEYLIDVALRKSAQAIFTTHSNDALKPLPSEAIWASINNDVVQGKLDIAALRAVTGDVDAQLALFVEDRFAKSWVESIVRSKGDVAMDVVEVHALEGDGSAVKINKSHNLDPASRFPSVCVIDGDSRQAESDADFVYRLPGRDMPPERYVYERVLDAEAEHGRLVIRLSQDTANTPYVIDTLRRILAENRDHHLLFSQAAEGLGYLSLPVVEAAFLKSWEVAYPDEAREILEKFSDKLPSISA